MASPSALALNALGARPGMSGLFASSKPEHSFAKNLSEICEARLGSKQFVNIMMIGVAYQLGLIPVSAHSIAWAIKDTIRRDHRKNLKAVRDQ